MDVVGESQMFLYKKLSQCHKLKIYKTSIHHAFYTTNCIVKARLGNDEEENSSRHYVERRRPGLHINCELFELQVNLFINTLLLQIENVTKKKRVRVFS